MPVHRGLHGRQLRKRREHASGGRVRLGRLAEAGLRSIPPEIGAPKSTTMYTLIDGILFSVSLTPLIRSCNILHLPLNTSDHLPVELVIDVDMADYQTPCSKVTNYIPWASLSEEETMLFRDTMLSELNKIHVPRHALDHGSNLCESHECSLSLEKFYCDINSAILKADLCLPRIKHGLAKPFWCPELDCAKRRSMDAYKMWADNGSPRSGPIFLEKQRATYDYKTLLRRSKNMYNSSVSSDLGNDLVSRDTQSFWKKWGNLRGPNATNNSMVGGFVGNKDIADCFSDTYKAVYVDSEANSVLREKFVREFDSYRSSRINDSIVPDLLSWSDMINAVLKMKIGKATSTFLKTEHIFNGCPELLRYLLILFNGMISHSYLPHEFLLGTISPIIKDSNGDVSDPNNYRPVTLGPCLAQLFEYCLLDKFGSYLRSDDLQFGFKRAHSTSHAIFALKSCVDYYLKNNTGVFVTFLDCSKAFDRVSHYGIFLKLMSRNVPLAFLNLIIYWYLNMSSCCQWNGEKSEYFRLITGTKQGGVLSPRIFAVYMDDLIIELRKSGIGCHVVSLFVACIVYADDLCLIAPTRGAMQLLLSICEEYCGNMCLNFNSKKSKALFFGYAKVNSFSSLFLGGKPIDYVQEWNYLGTKVVAGKTLSFSPKDDLRKFYRATNSVLSFLQKPNEMVQMQLLYSICVPLLTYASDVKEFSNADMHTCNVTLNDAIRRIFSFHRWESPRALRQHLGFHNIYEIFHMRQSRFFIRRQRSSNHVIAYLTNKL